MRKVLLTGLAMVALSLAPSVVNAASFAPIGMDPDGAITLVSGGCGPAGFRAANGVCYRRRPPPPYYRRACPPGLHLTRFGCRPNF